jgi:hypothetical protein
MEFRWESEWTVPSIVGVVSFGVGAAIGYGVAKWRGNKEINDIFNTINDIAEEHVTLLSDIELVPKFIIEEEAFEVEEIILEEEEMEVVDYRRAEEMQHTSIFPVDTPEWDYVKELDARTPEKPYIIHRDEFFTNPSGYGQSTLTYYKGDDVLLDEQDVPLYDAKNIVCELEFGKGSEDPNVVYIRNEKLEAEYEILLETGYYAIEVLGAEMEGSFDSDKPTLMKFRD